MLGIFVVIAMLLVFSTVVAQEPTGNNASVLQKAAETYGLNAKSLKVINSATATYPLQGITVESYKIIDQSKGDLYPLDLDLQGQVVDKSSLDAAEVALRESIYGRMDVSLFDTLQGMNGDEMVSVTIRVQTSEYQPARPDGTDAQIEDIDYQTQFWENENARAAAFASQFTAPVINKLAALGYTSLDSPMTKYIYTTLPAKVVYEVAAWPEVNSIGLTHQVENQMDIAWRVIGANIPYSRHYAGWGDKLGEIEVGGQIATANPYLAGAIQDTTYSCLSAHTTAVAGMIRSWHPTYFGVSPAVSLWVGGSCGGWESEVQNRTSAAVTWGARITNHSYGRNTNRAMDNDVKYYDDLVWYNSTLPVIAAGNRGAGCGYEGNVLAPAIAYNVLTVGNFDDRNTLAAGDDIMSSCSSWVDPISTHSDREKPEVAAPGTNINSTTTAYPWVGGTGSGTSYSSPMTAGGALVLTDRSATLFGWPEAIKAIMMTGATHNIEGATRLSEYDGAGGIYLEWADDIVRGTNGGWGKRSYDCSVTTPTYLTTIYIPAGGRFRATIVWDNDPDYVSYLTQPGADLDLILTLGSTTVTGSYSWDNTYEIIDWTAPSSGNYVLKVNKARCSFTPHYLGWAWRIGN